MKRMACMKFEDVLGNERLWAVVYDGEADNILSRIFSQWVDLDSLYSFFEENHADLNSYFRITDISQAVFETVTDAMAMKAVLLDVGPDTHLDRIFRPLENFRMNEMILSREKAKGSRQFGHASWLRLYALKFEPDTYLVTGGAIKLTRTMEEREHTRRELVRMEQVRDYLLEQGAVDLDGFKDYMS